VPSSVSTAANRPNGQSFWPEPGQMNHYRERRPITKLEFLQILEAGDQEAIARSIMDAVQSINDSSWLLVTLKYILQNRTELWVIGTSIVALTELALFNPQIDPNYVYLLIEPFEQKEDFKDWAHTALDDLRNLMLQRTL
jgi:hypothetical protein